MVRLHLLQPIYRESPEVVPAAAHTRAYGSASLPSRTNQKETVVRIHASEQSLVV